VGAFLAGLARGLNPEAAARRATIAAALAVTRRGPGTGPTREEVDELLGAGRAT
jgi:sugar/nucleoside kinase (ribokinase family)